MAYEICIAFYSSYKQVVDSKNAVHVPNKENFDIVLQNIKDKYDDEVVVEQELIHLYKVTKTGELESFNFQNEDQLYNLNLFVALNFVTKQIFIVENPQNSPSNRLLFLAGKAISELNQKEFKSEFSVQISLYQLRTKVG